jgi:hypothetical protein
MLGRGLTLAGGLALGLATLLLCVTPVSAQRFGRGGWGGYPGGWYGYNTYSYSSPQNFTYGNYYHPYSGNYWDYSYAAPYPSGYYTPGMAPVYSDAAGPRHFGQYAASGGGYPGGWYGYNTYSYSSPQNFTYGNYYHPYSGNYWDYSYAAPY